MHSNNQSFVSSMWYTLIVFTVGRRMALKTSRMGVKTLRMHFKWFWNAPSTFLIHSRSFPFYTFCLPFYHCTTHFTRRQQSLSEMNLIFFSVEQSKKDERLLGKILLLPSKINLHIASLNIWVKFDPTKKYSQVLPLWIPAGEYWLERNVKKPQSNI